MQTIIGILLVVVGAAMIIGGIPDSNVPLIIAGVIVLILGLIVLGAAIGVLEDIVYWWD